MPNRLVHCVGLSGHFSAFLSAQKGEEAWFQDEASFHLDVTVKLGYELVELGHELC